MSEERVDVAAVQQRCGRMTARCESVKLSASDDIAAVELKLQSFLLAWENTLHTSISISGFGVSL